MPRVSLLLPLLLAAGVVALSPSSVAAQRAAPGVGTLAKSLTCDQGCSRVHTADDETVGWGCTSGNDGGGYACGASVSGCVVMICSGGACCRGTALRPADDRGILAIVRTCPTAPPVGRAPRQAALAT